MHRTLLSLSLLWAGALAAPVQNSTWSACAAKMDNHLPYSVPTTFNYSGTVRRYYVAAEIDTWDYAPSGWDNWLGVPMNESFRAQTWGYIASNESLGTRFDKALFKGYTDATFTVKTVQPDWLGYQGPIIRAEVGDMIEIMFVNKMDHFYASMHSMGLFYSKESEGSVYYNGTWSVAEGDAVPPGGCFVYKWLVPDPDLPNPGYQSKLYSYHSYVSMYEDQDAGLSGPVIIYNRGQMESVMASNREFVVFYGDNQESNSFLALQNVQKYLPGGASMFANMSSEYPRITTGGNESFWYPQMINSPKTNVTTEAAPNFFPINGYIFANNPAFDMCQYDNTIWYLWDMGFDTHVVHWHGNNVVMNQLDAGVVPINPGQSTTVTMQPASYGWWHVLCHFNTHLDKGMEASYVVYPANECPLQPLKPMTPTTSMPATSMPASSMPTAPMGKGNNGQGNNGQGNNGQGNNGQGGNGNAR